jgi:tetratricopeptide (TPR) repeat protein
MVDRARDMLEELVADPEQFASALSHLATVDPRAAEVHLRAALAGEWSGWARGQLLGLLVGQGRTLESLEIFEQSLAAGLADSSTWWQMLTSLPRTTIDAELERWLALGPQNVDALNSIANFYTGQGDTQRALDMFEQMWSTALEQGAYLPQLPYDLIKAQPGGALALLDQAQGSLPENDEMWGDLADAYWQAGEEELAVAAWQHAKELDPDDGEWTGKLATAANGGVPVWMGEQAGPLGDTTDLWSQPPPLNLFDGYAPVGLGYWEGDLEVEFGGIPLLGGTSDVAGNLVQVGYVGADW